MPVRFAILTLFAGVVVAADSTAKGRWHCQSDMAIYRSGNVVVFKDDNYENKIGYRACWVPSGRVRLLEVDRPGSRKWRNLGGTAARGRWLVWHTYQAGDLHWLHSLNIANGGRGPTVNVPAGAPA